jgi:hypothetical protein
MKKTNILYTKKKKRRLEDIIEVGESSRRRRDDTTGESKFRNIDPETILVTEYLPWGKDHWYIGQHRQNVYDILTPHNLDRDTKLVDMAEEMYKEQLETIGKLKTAELIRKKLMIPDYDGVPEDSLTSFFDFEYPPLGEEYDKAKNDNKLLALAMIEENAINILKENLKKRESIEIYLDNKYSYANAHTNIISRVKSDLNKSYNENGKILGTPSDFIDDLPTDYNPFDDLEGGD